MFKNLRSNRDPRDTLYREIKKEFGAHFTTAGGRFRNFSSRYPKFLFGAMVTAMLVSLGLSFTVFRPKPPAAKSSSAVTKNTGRKGLAGIKKMPESSLYPVTNGFDRILALGAAIKETVALKKLADSLIAKKTLTGQDSVTLGKTLDRLQQINNELKTSR